MHLQILIEYISRELHTFVRTYSHNIEEMASFCAIRDFEDPYYDNIPLCKYMTRLEQEQQPILFSFGNIYYALLSDQQDYFLVGPVLFETPISLFLSEEQSIDQNWITTLPTLEFSHYIKHILLFHNLFAETPCNQRTLLRSNLAQREINEAIQTKYTRILFENQENTTRHNPYDQELREQSSIEHGDLEQLQQSLSEDYVGNIGTLAKDPVRNIKNLAIVLVTLASRSAIRGGLSPEIAFSLSDSYIQQIEEINDISNLTYFAKEIEYHYTSLVHDIRSQKDGKKTTEKNPHIEKCKDYIFSHLHDRITVDVLAQELGYHPDYLSHLFKEWEGIGVSQYIIREKITRAKNLLTYSNYTYSEIATYLGFASQSHFGKHFKKITGYTPRQYRDNFGRRS